MKPRRTIRRFKKDKPIPKETLELLLDVAQYAPCPSGYMVWEYVVVTEKEKIKGIQDALKSFYQGPGSKILEPIMDSYIQTEFYQNRLKVFQEAGIPNCEECPVQCEKTKGEFNAAVYFCRTWLAYRTATALIVVLNNPIQRDQYRANAKAKSTEASMISRYEETVHAFETAAANLAIENILITAHALGLGTAYTHCGNSIEPQVKKILKIPRKPELVGIICMGYPDIAPKLKPRQALADFVSFEEYKK
jgi:nitroreductase